MHEPDDLMQAKIVHMILNRKTEEAFSYVKQLLSY